jgi:CBS domain-containing protein
MSLREFCQRQVISIAPENSIVEACRLMENHDIGCLVVQEKGKMCGILTDRDVALKVSGQSKDPNRTRVREVMSRSPIRIPVDKGLQELTNLMRVHRVRRVPIVDGLDEVLGIVTMDDVLQLIGGEISDLGNALAKTLPAGTA